MKLIACHACDKTICSTKWRRAGWLKVQVKNCGNRSTTYTCKDCLSRKDVFGGMFAAAPSVSSVSSVVKNS